MSRTEEDRYFAENVVVAERLGAANVPASRMEVDAFLRDVRPELQVDERVREVRGVLMNHKASKPAMQPALNLIMKAGADLLPDWAQRAHGFRFLPGERMVVRTAAMAAIRTVGWAMTAPRR